jgi:predicted PurR-regulated permease PerM
LPPALTLFSVIAFGTLFGLLGVLFAAPLTVVAYVAVLKLYVVDTLDEQVRVPGAAE